MTENKEELKSLLIRVKKKWVKKNGLQLNIQKAKIMESSPITSWQTVGEKVEVVTDFLFSGTKISVNGGWSHEIKKCWLLGRKTKTNPHSRVITLLTKVYIYNQCYSFPLWMWELNHNEGWQPKNWCFWTVVLGKTLESLLDSKGIKQVNHWKDRYWSWNSNNLATWCKELTH